MPNADFDLDIEDEKDVTLGQIISRAKEKFMYEYDFGDDWGHLIILEKILPPEARVDYPGCVTGKRAGPPEDCGAIFGYYGFLEAISDPKHPEHDDMLEWVGGA